MKLLLVEDEGPKLEKIKACIQTIMPNSNIHTARSVRSALDLLDSAPFDMIILDMSLPTFDISEDEYGGRPQGFGGLEVMRDMTNYEIITPVVVVTAYEYFPGELDGPQKETQETTLPELQAMLKREFSEIFVDLVKYDTLSDEWQEQLTCAINGARH